MPKKKTRKAAKAKARAANAGKLKFNHAMIYVKEVGRALEFYAGRLGFQLIEQFPGYARLRSPSGTTTIALHQLDRGMTSLASEGIRLYFEVENLDQFCARLVAAGVQIPQMPKVMPWGWKHAYMNDPDGHEISVYWAGEKRLKKSNWS